MLFFFWLHFRGHGRHHGGTETGGVWDKSWQFWIHEIFKARHIGCTLLSTLFDWFFSSRTFFCPPLQKQKNNNFGDEKGTFVFFFLFRWIVWMKMLGCSKNCPSELRHWVWSTLRWANVRLMPTVGGRFDGLRGVNCDSCPDKKAKRAGGAVNNIIEHEYRETSLVGKEAFPFLKHHVLISLILSTSWLVIEFDGDKWQVATSTICHILIIGKYQITSAWALAFGICRSFLLQCPSRSLVLLDESRLLQWIRCWQFRFFNSYVFWSSENSKRAHFLPIILDANQLNEIWFYNSTTFKIKTCFISFQVLSNSFQKYLHIFYIHKNFPEFCHLGVSTQTLGLFQNGNPLGVVPPCDDWISHAARPMRRAWLASARVASGSGELRKTPGMQPTGGEWG